MAKGRAYSPFTVILVTVALSVLGLLGARGLQLSYTPIPHRQMLQVWVTLPDAAPAVMEAEVTSRLEAALSVMPACKNISSTSYRGSAAITLELDRRADLQQARFEASTRLASLWPSLPPGTGYPYLTAGGSGERGGQLVWRLRSPRPASAIAEFARRHLTYPLSGISGVESVSISGDTPYEWEIIYDADKAAALGVTGDDITEAVRTARRSEIAGLWEEDGRLHAVLLQTGDAQEPPSFYDIPVPVRGMQADSIRGQRLVPLGELATFHYRERPPQSYFRLNGLNTVTLVADLSPRANLLVSARALRQEMAQLQGQVFPADITAELSYDSSEYIADELQKILLRTGLCLLILLLFSLLVSRSWRKMLILMLSLAASLLMALGLYRLLGLPIHIYTLAGITVSLGIIIDTSILMTDHYGKYHDYGAFPSIVYAVLTTLAALLLVLLLPQQERLNLTDFMAVIVVNLSVSLAVSGLLVPALVDVLGDDAQQAARRPRRSRVRFYRGYRQLIAWGTRHRWLWVLALLVAFGLPLYLLPQASSLGRDDDSLTARLVRWEPYAAHRSSIDKVLGSLSGLFHRSLDRANFYREPDRTVLSIRAGMPEGCTVAQLNDVMLEMENFLSQFPEIESFTTQIRSRSDGEVTVRFKPEFEDTAFPARLKSEVTAAAISYGGANWSISGVNDQYFNNNIVTDHKSDQITLHGYNYEQLQGYAQQLVAHLAENRRVSGPEIRSGSWWGRPDTELHVHYDREALAASGVRPETYYQALSQRLFTSNLDLPAEGGVRVPVTIRSSDADRFDLWHVRSVPIPVDSTAITLSGIGDIEKRRSGIDIYRDNQSYTLRVCYDFIGSWQLSRKLAEDTVNWLNQDVLPVGYKAETPSGFWSPEAEARYLWLILLIVAVIWVMLTIAFESLRAPLAVILMIPVSFLGLFLTFGLSDFTFDRGGFAALVMLCGLTVNAGIYLVCACRTPAPTPARYLRAFRQKIGPISLTVLSTILGLLPFLSDGPKEVFWFDFAVGTISGMAFSVFALLMYLPVFLCKKA